jgi:hypothetical protein
VYSLVGKYIGTEHVALRHNKMQDYDEFAATARLMTSIHASARQGSGAGLGGGPGAGNANPKQPPATSAVSQTENCSVAGAGAAFAGGSSGGASGGGAGPLTASGGNVPTLMTDTSASGGGGHLAGACSSPPAAKKAKPDGFLAAPLGKPGVTVSVASKPVAQKKSLRRL